MTRRRIHRATPDGFTLLEMLAVIFLMSIVLFVATDFYLDLSRASNEAAAQTRGARRAVMLLDRVARDLEGAVMLQKPADLDPIAFPWLFLAEAESVDSGADRVKFVRRGHHPSASDAAESDLELVSWIVTPGLDGEGDFELRRWSWPQLGDSLDRTFPTAENSDLVAAGIASFGIKFMGEAGEWTGRWDSTTLAASSELPTAAEIEVSFHAGVDGTEIDGPYVRRVLLPMRPIDLEDQLAEAAGAEGGGTGLPGDEDSDGTPDAEDEFDDDGDDGPAPDASGDEVADGDEPASGGKTVAQCLAANPQLRELFAGNPAAEAAVESAGDQPASQFTSIFPGIPADCL